MRSPEAGETAVDPVAALENPAHQHRVLVERLVTSEEPVTWTYGEIRSAREGVRQVLADRGVHAGQRVGLVADNGPEWVAADQALLADGVVEVPVPLAFSRDQAASLILGCEVCLVDDAGAERMQSWGLADDIALVPIRLDPGELVRPHAAARPTGSDEIIKIIHTSGTTGTPKGVMIRRDGLAAVIGSLGTLVPPAAFHRYLSVVPLSLLIEQIAGVYLPMTQGGRIVLLPTEVPLLGTTGSSAAEVLDRLWPAQPSATVLPPALVALLARRITEGSLAAPTSDPPFLMTGGAPVSRQALEDLQSHGIPVHEGYGLSENTSVVTWNPPGAVKPGTAGPPLPHCEVAVSDAGELLVRSTSLLAGYVGEDPTSRPVNEGWLHTGDRAHIDDDGYVTVLGRMKNVIITSHGRNVSPEYVEGRLRSLPGVREAVVFGDGLEHLVALILVDPAVASLPDDLLARARADLSDTDLPATFLAHPDTASFRSTHFTVTGRPRRDQLWSEVVAPALDPLAPATASQSV